MKVLLDTHTAIFTWSAPENLSNRARDILLNRENTICLSQISTLEIALKYRIGKMELPASPVEYVSSRVQLFGFNYIQLEDEDILNFCNLHMHHRDPFDGLIIATAQRLQIPILGKDDAFKQYPVDLIW
ncbi:type II toxin-antitoxin system VapC family toxin [bacterium]|nr:type II toxin-antitoxin system VapC family toxin [bacterium]